MLILALLGTVMTLYGFRFGRDTGCALLATMLALKPVEMRTLRDARSLLGFALFAPFATFLLDQGPRTLVLGLLAALAVLATLLKLSEVEVGDVAPAGRPWRRFVAVARMIAIGLPLAMGVFWLFPRFSSPLWGVPERALTRPGLSDRMSPGDWIDLVADDSPALRATFFGEAPPQSQMYWRGPVLWDFDGRSWTAVEWSWGIGDGEAVPGPKRYAYELEIEPTDRNQLVALELPLAAPPGARLYKDFSLRSRQPLTAVTRWRMTSAPQTRLERDLHPALRKLALRLPPGYNPRTQALAQRWRQEAGPSNRTNDTAIVKRALDWVRTDFAYTLDTPLLGRHSVDEFLFDQQAGFCEHFSSAFVVLMRASGIPARVVTGYVGGYRNPVGGYWLVRRSDAHAWAEVWLQGQGWVRVDPTAAVRPSRISLGATAAHEGAGAPWYISRWWMGLRDRLDVLNRWWQQAVVGFDALRQRGLLTRFGVDPQRWQSVALALGGALALVLAISLALSLRQGHDASDALGRGFAALERRLSRAGHARRPGEAPASYLDRIAALLPAGKAAALRALSTRFVQLRYACTPPAPRLAVRDWSRQAREFRP